MSDQNDFEDLRHRLAQSTRQLGLIANSMFELARAFELTGNAKVASDLHTWIGDLRSEITAIDAVVDAYATNRIYDRMQAVFAEIEHSTPSHHT